jgi:hypothetical protein
MSPFNLFCRSENASSVKRNSGLLLVYVHTTSTELSETILAIQSSAIQLTNIRETVQHSALIDEFIQIEIKEPGFGVHGDM